MGKPAWVLNYESLTVTSLLLPMVTSVTYTDNKHGESDTLELGVEDSRALWRTGWYPSKGDRLDLSIGYEGQELLPCGKFQVDEVQLDGPADTCTIRALASNLSTPLRTKRNRKFENRSLKDITTQIASEEELELMGTIRDVPLKLVTQSDETNLEFLKKLADEYGYAFNVRNTLLVFWDQLSLEATEPVRTYQLSDLKRYSFKSTTQHTYVACEVSYLDSDTGQLIKGRALVANMRIRGSETVPGDVKVPDEILTRKGQPDVGHLGDLVDEWQIWLKSKGWYDYKIDKWFGPITERGTKILEAQAGIEQNGIVEAETWKAAIEMGFRPKGSEDKVLGEILYKNVRVESVAEAEEKARAYLFAANRLAATGQLSLLGHPLLCSGAVIELTEDMYRVGGKYVIDKATHRLTKSGGWTVDADVTYVP